MFVRQLLFIIFTISVTPMTFSLLGEKRNRDWFEDTLRRARPGASSREGQLPPWSGFTFPRCGDAGFVTPECASESFGHMMNSLVNSGTATKAGYGFVVGYCSGFAVKRVAKAAAFVIGGAFVVVQSLAYRGYVKVNQDQVSKDVEDYLDFNKDGRVDARDAEIAYDRLQSMLAYNLPSGGGFTAGLYTGIRS
jgi:uncharacterized membrane protein (Fun14 family)